MNLILFSHQDRIAEHKIVLRDERFQQIRKIHQSKINDTVRIGELNGLMGNGTIQSIDEKSVEIAIHLEKTPPPKLPLTIILALPRPKMIRRIFRSIAEFGVQELIVVNSYKVEKSFWQSPVLSEQQVRQHLISGLQQSKDTVLPPISFKRLFKPFVEDELPSIIKDSQALIAHPGTANACPQQINTAATLAIGPEGGFTDYEAGKFLEAGFEGIHLGPRILRVENALSALIAKLY